MTKEEEEDRANVEYHLRLMQSVANGGCYTHSGGAIYHGQHWGPFAQASGYTSGLPNLGTAAQQAALQARAAQQHALAQQGFAFPYDPEPSKSIEDAGISAGEIIAYRAWRVNNKAGLLQSITVDTIWAPGEPMEGAPDDSPFGVFAFKSGSQVLTEYLGHTWTTAPIAVGTVALWGTVIEHELGYRAQFGKVNSLDGVYSQKPLRKKWFRKAKTSAMLNNLRQMYGVS
jgi:hypothetical protein